MNRKILVTGGAGFIGSNYVHLLMESEPEAEVYVLDKLSYAGNKKNLEKYEGESRFHFIHADLSDPKLSDILEKFHFQEIVHFAAETHVDRSIHSPEEFVFSNVVGTYRLLEIAKKRFESGNFKRFLHVSTDEVYGSLGETGSFSETTSYAPNSPYSATKAGSDHLVRAYFHTYGLPTVTTNCSNNYGPFQFPEKLIPLMILNAKNRKPLPVYGKGENIRDWLYVKDHCLAIETVLKKGRLGETYVIGTRNEKTNIEIVKIICKILDEWFPGSSPHESLIHFVKDRPGHDFRYSIDPSKIESELGWKPKYEFTESIRETVDWYLKNENYFEKKMTKVNRT
jgi:dTDP-glucose 4,6-dehydratase